MSLSKASHNTYDNGDMKNIICLLLKIVAFIRQHKLENKTVKNISQINKFSFVAWNFLLCYRMLWTLTIFILFSFIFLILYWFYFIFIFLLDNKKVCDIVVTWYVTWCDIIGLEQNRIIWKIMSRHMVYT